MINVRAENPEGYFSLNPVQERFIGMGHDATNGECCPNPK